MQFETNEDANKCVELLDRINFKNHIINADWYEYAIEPAWNSFAFFFLFVCVFISNIHTMIKTNNNNK